MDIQNIIQKSIEHYEHACEKHPRFCERILTNIGHYHKSHYNYIEQRTKRDCEKLPTAENILLEEVSEAFNAYSEALSAYPNKEKYVKFLGQHIEECYDCAAVIFRMIEEAENELERIK